MSTQRNQANWSPNSGLKLACALTAPSDNAAARSNDGDIHIRAPMATRDLPRVDPGRLRGIHLALFRPVRDRPNLTQSVLPCVSRFLGGRMGLIKPALEDPSCRQFQLLLSIWSHPSSPLSFALLRLMVWCGNEIAEHCNLFGCVSDHEGPLTHQSLDLAQASRGHCEDYNNIVDWRSNEGSHSPPSSGISTTWSTPTPATSTGSLPVRPELIRKGSPVKHRGDIIDVPLTRARTNRYPNGSQEDDGDFDELDPGQGEMHRPDLDPLESPLPRAAVQRRSHPPTRGRKSDYLKAPSIPHPVAARNAATTVPIQRTASGCLRGTVTGSTPRDTNLSLNIPVSTDSARSAQVESPGLACSHSLTPNHTRQRPKEVFTPEIQATGHRNGSPIQRIQSNTDLKSTTTWMRWGDPGEVDVIWISHLLSLDPFAAGKKEVIERFVECADYLRTHPDKRSHFENLAKGSLRHRYETLKAWLKRVKVLSARASGTQEEDGKLRQLIRTLVTQEEEMTALADDARAVKAAAANAIAKANDLRDARAARTPSAPPKNRPNVEVSGDDTSDEEPQRTPRTL
ncbi:hypothetical protein DFH28DRAFT_929714 [Melampsora americana]|nr:hypothetical protein DFH28DRAFT_929714 [Melampsora americana]